MSSSKPVANEEPAPRVPTQPVHYYTEARGDGHYKAACGLVVDASFATRNRALVKCHNCKNTPDYRGHNDPAPERPMEG